VKNTQKQPIRDNYSKSVKNIQSIIEEAKQENPPSSSQ